MTSTTEVEITAAVGGAAAGAASGAEAGAVAPQILRVCEGKISPEDETMKEGGMFTLALPDNVQSTCIMRWLTDANPYKNHFWVNGHWFVLLLAWGTQIGFGIALTTSGLADFDDGRPHRCDNFQGVKALVTLLGLAIVVLRYTSDLQIILTMMQWVQCFRIWRLEKNTDKNTSTYKFVDAPKYWEEAPGSRYVDVEGDEWKLGTKFQVQKFRYSTKYLETLKTSNPSCLTKYLMSLTSNPSVALDKLITYNKEAEKEQGPWEGAWIYRPVTGITRTDKVVFYLMIMVTAAIDVCLLILATGSILGAKSAGDVVGAGLLSTLIFDLPQLYYQVLVSGPLKKTTSVRDVKSCIFGVPFSDVANYHLWLVAGTHVWWSLAPTAAAVWLLYSSWCKWGFWDWIIDLEQ